jgi:hypothetical protein
MLRKTFQISEDEEKPRITIGLPKNGATVTGLIDNKSNRPLIMVRSDRTAWAFLQPDSDGRYKAENLPAGEYTVTYWHFSDSTESPIRVTLAEGESKSFNIDSSQVSEPQVAFLLVQVVNEDGLVLTEAESWVSRDGEYIEPTGKSSHGHVFITSPGEYILQVTCSGHEEVTRNVSLEPVDMENLKLPEVTVIKLKKK